MALLNITRSVFYFSKSFKKYSSRANSLVNLTVNESTGIATATLQRPPVNSLNLELLTDLCNTLTELESNKCRGFILTSSSNSVFSAGLDILEMYRPKPDRFKEWWTTLQQMWIKLYGSSCPSVAVINGHAPAGGCLLAMSTEYRIMLNNFTIGLNETQLGIAAPRWVITPMKNTLGSRQSELALTTGRLFKTDEALSIGLIDEVAANKEEGIAKAEKFLQKFANIPPSARALTKHLLRGTDIKELMANQEQDLQIFMENVTKEPVQKGLEMSRIL